MVTSRPDPQGWVIHGIAIRLAISTGLHHIASCSFDAVSAGSPADKDPLLRQKKYLLPPPEDRLELAERIHTLYVSPRPQSPPLLNAYPVGPVCPVDPSRLPPELETP